MSSPQGHLSRHRPAASRVAPPAVPRDSRAALELVRLNPLIERTRGSPDVRVGLIDGPVALDHPHLAGIATHGVGAANAGACARASSDACRHGTLVAGVLVGARASGAPAICPGCTLLIRPIFLEAGTSDASMPVASMEDVAAAIVETVDAGASILNLSVAVAEPSSRGEALMDQALDYAAKRGVLVVAAAGNQGTVGSSAITRHPWVIAVVACDSRAG
jgi:subtilisin family serine protease